MSTLWDRKGIRLAYAEATVNWLSNYAAPVIESMQAALGTSRSLGSYSETGSEFHAKRWSTKFDIFEWLTDGIAEAHTAKRLWIAYPTSPFTLRGPFDSNLRMVFEAALARHSLPQTSPRRYQHKTGQFRL